MTVALLEAPRRPAEQRELQAEMVRVWAELDRMDAAAGRRVLARVAEMRADVLDRLAALPTATIDDVETFQSTSLRVFSAELDDAATRFAQRYGMDLASDMRGTAAFSDEAHRAALTQLARATGVPPALISFSPLGLADQQIEAAVLFSNSAIKGVGQAVIDTVNRELQSVVFGLGSRWDAVKNIRSALGTTGKSIGALTQRALTIERTGLIAALNISAEHAYRQSVEELPDLQVEWMATQGPRTCPTCASLNGQRKKPGGSFSGGVIAPPRHPRCRCRVVAAMPGWDDISKKPTVVRPPTVRRPSAAERAETARQQAITTAAIVEPGKHATLQDVERGMHARYPNINFDFLGAHIDTINPSMRAFHTLAQKYPEVASRLEYVGVRPDKNGGGSSFKSNTWAYATRDGKVLGLNRDWYGNPTKFAGSLRYSVETKFHPPGTEPFESVITHEFGHHVHNWNTRRGSDQILPGVWASGVGMRRESVERWLDAKKAPSGKLSQYAKTSNEERFAELFAASRLPGPTTPVVRQFRVLLDEVVEKPALKTGVANVTWVGSLPDAERQQAIVAMQALAKRLGVKWP